MDDKEIILNTAVINDLTEIIGDDLIEIYDEFNTSSVSSFETAYTALSNKDYDQLCTIIHSMKGSAGNIGLELLSNKCHAFESSLRNHDDIDHEQILSSIEQTFKNSINALAEKGLLS